MNPYVFLFGCARSGTTLLERLADAHPQLAVVHATRWIVRRHRSRDGSDEDHVSEAFCHELAADKRFGVLGLTLDDLMRILRERPGMDHAAFVSALFDAYGERQGKPLVGDRSPEYVKSLPLLHRLWPRARFVHIIRDGRDVWLSVSRWQKGAARYPTWETDPVVTTACWWERNVRPAREAGSRLGPDLYHELR